MNSYKKTMPGHYGTGKKKKKKGTTKK